VCKSKCRRCSRTFPPGPNRTGLTDAAVSIVKQRMLARWNRVGPLLPSSGPLTVRPSVCDGVRRDHKLSKSTWNRKKYQAQDNCNNYDTFHSISPFSLVWAASPIAALAARWSSAVPQSCPAALRISLYACNRSSEKGDNLTTQIAE
jgi:hypothetical protein